MYIPDHFAISDADVQAALRAGGFAHLVTSTADGLMATPMPFLYDPVQHALIGHVARNNPHWRVLTEGESLAVFAGPQAYVSPSLYAAKAEHGRVVPTWNYEVLHVYGQARAHDDVEWLRGQVTALTREHESGRAMPWQVTDAPGRYIEGQLRAIVGVELRITRVEGKAKLSQNRSEQDQAGVIAGLSASAAPGDRAVADAMRTRSH